MNRQKKEKDDRQIQALERAFLKQGGLCETMTRDRLAHRSRMQGSHQ